MNKFYYTSKYKSYITGAVAWSLSILIVIMLSPTQNNPYLYWTLDALGVLLCANLVSRLGARFKFSRECGEYNIVGDSVFLKLKNEEIIIKELKEISYYEDTLPHVFLGTCWDILIIEYDSGSITIQADRSEIISEKEDRSLYLLFKDIRRNNRQLVPILDAKGNILKDRWTVNKQYGSN